MNKIITYKGNQWFKCDLHLHTPASKCFQDQSVTPEEWVQKAIEQGLHCVAVTDHNTGEQIDAIKIAAAGTGLVVFPGVEITCDTSKVHLLVLFDVDKSTSFVNDFLIRCEIDRSNFADQSAHTTLSIFDVAQKANELGGIIIPAHIDEYNGLESIGYDNLISFFDLPYINAVQVVHKQFTDTSLIPSNNEPLKIYLNDYYSNPEPSIDFKTIANWYRPVKAAMEKKMALTTFSDNPHEPKNSKHGIDGIGTRFTWIKMDEYPTLEGLRQALLLPEFRVKNDFISNQPPYNLPDIWIKSMSINDTIITSATDALSIDFSPQLTTIIGGRGSGKSSLLRFIRGLFNRTADLNQLNDILTDHKEFYKTHDDKTKKGVLKPSSSVEIQFVRNGVLHKLTATEISNSEKQTVSIHKYDNQNEIWLLEESEGYIDFFEYEQYSQKQIYEIAQEPNSLRERIDKAIPELQILKNEREVIRKSFLEKSARIRLIEVQVSGKGKLNTEINDLTNQISLFQQSGIADLLTSTEQFTGQQTILGDFVAEAVARESLLQNLIESIELPQIDLSKFNEVDAQELTATSQSIINAYQSIKEQLIVIKNEAESLRLNFETELISTLWNNSANANKEAFESKKLELDSLGINDISNFERYSQEKAKKEKDFEQIQILEANLATEKLERTELQESYLTKTKAITDKRRVFVNTVLGDNKVKISVTPFRNKTDFVVKIRESIQRQSGFDGDVDNIVRMCFEGNVEQKIKNVREIFLKIKKGEQVGVVTGHFVNLVKNMTDAQIDEIELMLPEDEIEVKYKPSGSNLFKPLSTASAGQKTTAILTFILSYGTIPLILDQPEDDLDNRLVYELIVDRLKEAKENRQIIVVTHNANIPVNGDSEYILSMNSESKKLEVLCSGTVEQGVIKKEICDVMEGTEYAFDMRSKRYKQISQIG